MPEVTTRLQFALITAALVLPTASLQAADNDGAALSGSSSTTTPEGFVPLFNGTDFTGWRVPEGDNVHWKIINGVIDYDAQSEAPGDKHLWTEEDFGDFTLRVDWRIKETPYNNPRVRIVKPDGTHEKDAQGNDISITVPDSDSGILLRGEMKSQVNIWCWPVGSGEIYGYRMDQKMPPEVRAGVTPKVRADHDVGQWNTYEITVRGNRVSVALNGQQVLENAELPGLPERGPIGLQHHGGQDEKGQWRSPPSLVQFRNISVKRLN